MVLYMSHGIGAIKMISRYLKAFGVSAGILVLASCNTVDKDTTKVKFAANGYPSMFKPVRVDLAESKLDSAIGKKPSYR